MHALDIDFRLDALQGFCRHSSLTAIKAVMRFGADAMDHFVSIEKRRRIVQMPAYRLQRIVRARQQATFDF